MANLGLGRAGTGASAGWILGGPWGAGIGGGLGLIGDVADWFGQSDYEDRARNLQRDLENPTTPVGRARKLREDVYLGDVAKATGQAAGRTATTMGERGLGGSGYSTGAQADLMSQMALARLKAREAARSEAFQEGIAGLGAEGQARALGLQREALSGRMLDEALSGVIASRMFGEGGMGGGEGYIPGYGRNIRRPRMIVDFRRDGTPIYG